MGGSTVLVNENFLNLNNHCGATQSNNDTVKPLLSGLLSLNRASDLPILMLTLQKMWAVEWVWPITAYVFILIRTNLGYGHLLIPWCPDKRGLTVVAASAWYVHAVVTLASQEKILHQNHWYPHSNAQR